MLLRASGETQGESFDLNAVVDEKATSGVPHGEVLTSFAKAAVGESDDALRAARDVLEQEMGAAAVTDAAGIVANFQRMVRIADATGIPLDKPVAVFTVDMREELGLDDFGAARNTPPVGLALRTLGRLAQPLRRTVMRRYANEK